MTFITQLMPIVIVVAFYYLSAFTNGTFYQKVIMKHGIIARIAGDTESVIPVSCRPTVCPNQIMTFITQLMPIVIVVAFYYLSAFTNGTFYQKVIMKHGIIALLGCYAA